MYYNVHSGQNDSALNGHDVRAVWLNAEENSKADRTGPLFIIRKSTSFEGGNDNTQKEHYINTASDHGRRIMRSALFV